MKLKSQAMTGTFVNMGVILPLLAFAVPFVVSSPQIITGSLVNSLLFWSARRVNAKSQIATAIAPGIGVLSNGILFGKFTPYLLYFLPIIWIGNIILMRTFTSIKGKDRITRIVIPSLLKSAFLFGFSLVFFKIGAVPEPFLTLMGFMQLVTALLGGVLFTIYERY